MKTISTSRVITIVGLAAVVAGIGASLVVQSAFNVALVAGALVMIGMVGFACADYARKPRFRVRSERQSPSPAAMCGQPESIDESAGWTYQTVSA